MNSSSKLILRSSKTLRKGAEPNLKNMLAVSNALSRLIRKKLERRSMK
jgi:hypothetical protein